MIFKSQKIERLQNNLVKQNQQDKEMKELCAQLTFKDKIIQQLENNAFRLQESQVCSSKKLQNLIIFKFQKIERLQNDHIKRRTDQNKEIKELHT